MNESNATNRSGRGYYGPWWDDEDDGGAFMIRAGHIAEDEALWEAVRRGEVTVTYRPGCSRDELVLMSFEGRGGEAPLRLNGYRGRVDWLNLLFMDVNNQPVAIRWSDLVTISPRALSGGE